MHQFIHISAFGQRARRGEPRHATAAGMIGEAARLPGSVSHLSDPRPANILHGIGTDALFARLSEIRRCARDSAGRRLRCDAALVMIAVVSYPTPRAELSGAARDDYEAWCAATMAWLLDKFGEQLATILEHDDELYCHLHAVLLPEITPSGQLEWSRVHPGRAAKAASADRGDSRATQDALYRRSMSCFQDAFHQDVSIHFGHARVGPRRERRERHHHLELRASEAAVVALGKANTALRDQVEQLQRELARIRPQAPLPGSDAGGPSRPNHLPSTPAMTFEAAGRDGENEDFEQDVLAHFDIEADLDPDDDPDPEMLFDDDDFNDLDAFDALHPEERDHDDDLEPDDTDTEGPDYAE